MGSVLRVMTVNAKFLMQPLNSQFSTEASSHRAVGAQSLLDLLLLHHLLLWKILLKGS